MRARAKEQTRLALTPGTAAAASSSAAADGARRRAFGGGGWRRRNRPPRKSGRGFSLGADVFMDSDTRDTTNTTNDASNAKGTGTDDASLPGSAGLADLGAARGARKPWAAFDQPAGPRDGWLAEDAESMRLEPRFWRRERAKHARRVKEDRADTASAEKGERNAERTGGAPSAAEEAARRRRRTSNASPRRSKPRGWTSPRTTRPSRNCSPWSSRRASVF